MFKKLKGYRTLISNFLLAALPVIVLVDPASLNLTKEQLAAYTVAVTCANIYLRMNTTTAIGKKS